jgi:hypothetical protein
MTPAACTTIAPAGATVWTDGMAIAANLIVPAGTTVVIPAGAHITVAASALISVSGTLLVSACSAHATITWPAGASAGSGITVGSGGTLKVGGLDIVGAGAALNVLSGGSAEYDDGTITSSALPFNVSNGSTLTTQGMTVTGTRGTSQVSGTLVATTLDYDSNGNSGIVGNDNASLDIRNSNLHGNGPIYDMLISGGSVGGTMNVQNTEIYMVHCAFHFSPVKTFTISYANLHDNAYGFMLFGSGAAGGTMTYSNDVAIQFGFSVAEMNGPIVFDHDYIPDNLTAAGVTITNPSSSAVPGAGTM